MLVHQPSGTQVSLAEIERIHAQAIRVLSIPPSMLPLGNPLTTAEEIRLIEREKILKELRQYQAERGIKPA
jgi:hypothetical protein